MRDDQWQQAFDAGRAEAEGLVEALEAIGSCECVYEWADQPHEQMRERARTALAKYRAGQ